jgi:hypothetical protein
MSATVRIFSPWTFANSTRNLADDARRLQACQPREVDGALGLSRAHQHAAVARAQGIDIAGRDELRAAGILAHRLQNRSRAILRRDSRARRAPRGDCRRESRPERRLVVANHHAEPEPVDSLRRHRQANQSAREPGHEVDGFGRGLFGRHAQVALVLALLVIHQDDHVAAARFLERFLDGNERRARLLAGTYFTKHLRSR